MRGLGFLPVPADGSKRGILLIQLDGLSRKRFLRWSQSGDLPFLKGLMDHEDYSVWKLYPGLPTSTPSVQGELFYGAKQAVPSFSYWDRALGREARLYEERSAAAVEDRIASCGPPLLAGGSSYSNVFRGGAEEAHFCAVTTGWNRLWRWKTLAGALWFGWLHLGFLFRAAELLAGETLRFLTDFLKQKRSLSEVWRGISFLPARLAIGVLLRECVAFGARVDAARGLPIIHANFIQYDEWAHQEGPDSDAALRALRAIDRKAGELWREAARSTRRHYEVWFFSDHGHEATVPYEEENGRTLRRAVEGIWEKLNPSEKAGVDADPKSYSEGRAAYLGGARAGFPDKGVCGLEKPFVTAMGPVGHFYAPKDISESCLAEMAAALVREGAVPSVLRASASQGRLIWVDRDGESELMSGALRALGKEHPYSRFAAEDLADLMRHPDSGELVLLGYRREGKPISFSFERGSHAGPGPDETDAFVLAGPSVDWTEHLAEDALLIPVFRSLIQEITAEKTRRSKRRSSGEPSEDTVRVMTYNIHSAVGMDGKISVERIARIIFKNKPDLVALQEVDQNQTRTGAIDQARRIAEMGGFHFFFRSNVTRGSAGYGIAILSRYPAALVREGALPALFGGEPRGALWVEARLPSGPLEFMTTHLGLRGSERRLQAAALAGEEWMGEAEKRGRVVLAGDMNALASWPEMRVLRRKLRDAQMFCSKRPAATWPGIAAVGRIDHILADRGLEARRVWVLSGTHEKNASDHLPLAADLVIRARG